MVQVVTLQEFNELRGSIEQKLNKIENKLNELINNVNEKQHNTEINIDEIYKRIDSLSESNKGFIDRFIDAIRPSTDEPPPEQVESNQIENTEKTIGKVADVIIRCPNFFDWDWCQEKCPMYLLCADIAAVQDISKLPQKDLTERFKGFLKRLEGSMQSKKGEPEK